MIDYEKFQKSLKHLELQFENYQRMEERETLSELDREAIAESVIQRFQTCYDTLWKHLKRYLVEELGLPEVPNSPKPILRLAAENNMLGTPTERWMLYADARISTSHDYSGEKAKECLEYMQIYINDSITLYQRLTGQTWE